MQPIIRKYLLITFLFCQLCNAQTQYTVYPIKVNAGGYTGRIAISGRTNFFFLPKDTTLQINADEEGYYYLNTGTSIGACGEKQTSYIIMSFKSDGTISSICPKESADIGNDGKTISLNTACITIDPTMPFDREWYPSFDVASNGIPNYYYGEKMFKLIKGLTYGIDNAHTSLVGTDDFGNSIYYASYFYFTVGNNGNVILYGKNKISAIASGSKITFKTSMVYIDPEEICGCTTLYIRKPNSPGISIIKKTPYYFIKGTANYVFWYTKAGKESYFQFLPM